MKKQEIEKILNNASQKHSWIVKGFQDFLNAWAEIEVPGDYEGDIYLNLYISDCDNGNRNRYFLTLGKSKLDWEREYAQYPHEWNSLDNYPDLTLSRVKKCITALETELPKFFEKISIETKKDTEFGDKIQRILSALQA